MPSILGFDSAQKEHVLKNDYDGNLLLNVFAERARGKTAVTVNGTPCLVSDAGETERSPYFCGTLSVPRGQSLLTYESDCEPGRLLLGESLRADSMERFELLYDNRSGQFVFERHRPPFTEESGELLRRHGFLYDGEYDCACGRMPSGVPLGGFGTGKLEIAEDGTFTAFTGNNNQDSPIYRMPGSFFAFASGGVTRILRSHPLGLPYTPMARVEAAHEFPFARLKASDGALPFTAELEAFSPQIPGNAADSALPCVFMDLTLRNPGTAPADAAVCLSWENLINVGGSMNVTNAGERIFPLCYHTWNCSFVWSDRRRNHCVREGQTLRFYADDDRKNPLSFGTHLLWCSEADAEAVCGRSILPEDEKAFAAYLAGEDTPLPAAPESEFRAGAWILRRRLAAGEARTVRFVLCWYMPNLRDADGTEQGVEYVNRFPDARAVLDYALRERERLCAETARLNAVLHATTLPDRFVRRLLDDRFVMATDSWYDRAGNFSINEAPTGMGGCLGTLDQRTASQCYYTAFYPELDDRELDLFRRAQAEDGACAHEIGFAGIRLWARPFSKWPDLAASYVIQVFHHYQRTGDREMLLRHWPHVVRAIAWTETMDDAGCGIPYIKAGRGTTYDNQHWEGINAFIATMQIAAYRVGAACADAVGDGEKATAWTRKAEQAEATRTRFLWDGEKGTFINAYDPSKDERDDSVFIASLAGEWAQLRAGLTPALGRTRIARAADAIAAACVGDWGLTDQGGRKETTQGFTQYPLAYLASPALYCGNAAAAKKLFETTERVVDRPGVSTRYNQALTYGYYGQRHGLPYYMTAPASWNVLEALTGLSADVSKGRLRLSAVGRGSCRLPVFLPGAWFMLEQNADETELTLTPLRSIKATRFTELTLAGAWRADGTEAETAAGGSVFRFPFDPGKETLRFSAASR